MGADPNDAADAALLFTELGEVHALQHYVMGCRDAEDDHLYELAINAGASYIVSKDNKVLNPPLHVAAYLQSHGVKLISPIDFVNTVLNAVLKALSSPAL